MSKGLERTLTPELHCRGNCRGNQAEGVLAPQSPSVTSSGLPRWLSGKEFAHSAGNARDASSIPGLEDLLEKEMATHSSVLAWRIPGTAEPGGLPSMGLHRVGHDWNDLAAAAAYKMKIQGCILHYIALHYTYIIKNFKGNSRALNQAWGPSKPGVPCNLASHTMKLALATQFLAQW